MKTISFILGYLQGVAAGLSDDDRHKHYYLEFCAYLEDLRDTAEIEYERNPRNKLAAKVLGFG